MSVVAHAVKRVIQDSRGALTLVKWLGSGGAPVEESEANERAMVCASCPHNALKRRIEDRIAREIVKQEEIRLKLRLTTTNDTRLETCDVCGCYLKLKVWVPMRFQNKSLPFPNFCWMRKT